MHAEHCQFYTHAMNHTTILRKRYLLLCSPRRHRQCLSQAPSKCRSLPHDTSSATVWRGLFGLLRRYPLPRRELNYPRSKAPSFRKPTGPCVTLVCVQSQSQIAAISNRKSQCLLARTRNYNSQQDRTVAAISNRKCKSKLAKPCVLFCKIQQKP